MKRILFALLLTAAFVAGADRETPLDRYVKAPDPTYAWRLQSKTSVDGMTMFVLELTSQRWLTEQEVDKPVWKHWLILYKPDKVESDAALLIIEGGNNTSPAPVKPDAFPLSIAKQTKTVVVSLKTVPSEPLVFAGETRKRTEDQIIAYTWKKFLTTGDPKWPARLPMTKAAVKAMDATQQFMASQDGGNTKIARWVVTGGSKRGWTTWTTGAADPRVIAIMPVVIDMLNIEPSFIHHWRAYGFWAQAVGDYVQEGVMDWQGTKQYKDLMNIVEPYSYRDRLTMPKYIVNSTGDQFFLPDSWQFYWKGLKGEKYLRYVPNTDHGVTRKSDAGESLATYYESIVKNWKRPEFDWKVEKNGTITVKTKDKPSSVKVWMANNPGARDFRMEKIGPIYKSTDLQATRPGVYEVKAPAVEKGWTAYFIELTYPTPGGSNWKFTTGTKVWPDTYPYAPPVAKTPPEAKK